MPKKTLAEGREFYPARKKQINYKKEFAKKARPEPAPDTFKVFQANCCVSFFGVSFRQLFRERQGQASDASLWVQAESFPASFNWSEI